MSLLQLPLSKFKSLNLTSPFLHGSSPLLKKPSSSTQPLRLTASPMTIKAVKNMQGKVICDRSDKTVNVLVVRLAPHPKYKRRVRKLKKYQAHDPENRFKVGDIVQLQKIRPISKMKTFLAVPPPPRNSKPKKPVAVEGETTEEAVEGETTEEAVEEETPAAPQELGLPLESQQA